MNDDLEALVARLRSGSTYDDRTDAADLIEALQARVVELERLAGLADSWITAALECKDWLWDADQHEAATHTRNELRAALEGKKDE